MRVKCCLCGEEFDLLSYAGHIELASNKYVCDECLNKARHDMLVEYLKKKLEEKESGS